MRSWLVFLKHQNWPLAVKKSLSELASYVFLTAAFRTIFMLKKYSMIESARSWTLFLFFWPGINRLMH